MKIESSWIFDCRPEDIYPHFSHAQMDHTRPLAFRLGIPKPVSCKVLEGEPAIGRTRQCTTDRGYIRQEIIRLEQDALLTYRMQESNVWCRNWVAFLEDTFRLEPVNSDQTRVTRTTLFRGGGTLSLFTTLSLRFALGQAHRYAGRNWRRLGAAHKQQRLAQAGPAGA